MEPALIVTALLLLFSLVLVAIAIRHWYVALCGLVVLSVFLQFPAMPRSMFGIQGLNPWNAVMLAILAGWAFQGRREPRTLRAHMPVPELALFGAFSLMLIASGVVAALDVDAVQGDYPLHRTAFGMLIQTIINPLKVLLVGALIYLGANTRKRVVAALSVAVFSVAIYAILMHSTLGILALDPSEIRFLSDARIGLHPVAIAQTLVFGIWSAVVLAILATTRRVRLGWSACVALIGPALLSTYSRNGYLSFCSIGIALGVLRWRSLFIWVPLVMLVVQVGLPSVRERSLYGVATQPDVEHDFSKISSGRMDKIWPPVIHQIAESPLLGHGRFAILRESCYADIKFGAKVVPSHPHNAYLEVMLDSGLLGLAVCIAIILAILRVGHTLIRVREDPVTMGAGFLALIAVASICIAGLTNGGFYPRQDTLPNLVAIAAACAVYRSRPTTGASGEEPAHSAE
jgi:O-antigen ligase